MLTTAGKRLRAVATAAAVLALLAGTVWGNDHHFPFGPFRMYSTTTRADGGRVSSVRLELTAASGDVVEVRSTELGLRHAELLGQVRLVQADPDHLRYLARAYRDRRPEIGRIVEVRLYEVQRHLRGGKPVEITERDLARWTDR